MNWLEWKMAINNHLVKAILGKPFIPYSMGIGGQTQFIITSSPSELNAARLGTVENAAQRFVSEHGSCYDISCPTSVISKKG